MKYLNLFIIIVLAACAVTGDYKVVSQLYDHSAKFTRIEEEGYDLLRVTSEATNGNLLRIPREGGLFYLKVSSGGLLEEAIFAASTNPHAPPREVVTEDPVMVFQRQWNRSLMEMFDSQSVGAQCRHFWQNHLSSE